jgi:DNA-binding transcriptional regulator YdaS (Cro superfamily)
VNPAHLDATFTATDLFSHIVAHGMWTGALVSAVLGTRLPGPGTIYLEQNLKFLKPAAPNDTITATVTVKLASLCQAAAAWRAGADDRAAHPHRIGSEYCPLLARARNVSAAVAPAIPPPIMRKSTCVEGLRSPAARFTTNSICFLPSPARK